MTHIYNLIIATKDLELEEIYTNHNHFNPGDAGIDIYIPDDLIPPYAQGIQ
jgi:hypothetical protein